jgi:hypothetical protein
MGTATVDLPDPLESIAPANAAGAGSAGGSADELLAQLATSEIDRLLADADVERPTGAAPPAAPEAAPAPVIVETPVATVSAPAGEPTLQEIDEAGARQLDTLFEEIKREEASVGPATAAPVAAAGELSAPTAPQASTDTAPVAAHAVTEAPGDPQRASQLDALFTGAGDAAEETGGSERQALTEDLSPEQLFAGEVLAAQVLIEESADAALTESDDPSAEVIGPPSLLVRLLEWLNAPLAGCSESMREGLGKVAIMTLVNALAVLAYVVFFRK